MRLAPVDAAKNAAPASVGPMMVAWFGGGCSIGAKMDVNFRALGAGVRKWEV